MRSQWNNGCNVLNIEADPGPSSRHDSYYLYLLISLSPSWSSLSWSCLHGCQPRRHHHHRQCHHHYFTIITTINVITLTQKNGLRSWSSWKTVVHGDHVLLGNPNLTFQTAALEECSRFLLSLAKIPGASLGQKPLAVDHGDHPEPGRMFKMF